VNRPRKQHLVPKLLLKSFADEKEKIFVFDKFQNKSFISSVNDIATERDFYNTSTRKLYELTDDEQILLEIKNMADGLNLSTDELNDHMEFFIENFFATNIEPKLKRILNNISSVLTLCVELKKAENAIRYLKPDIALMIAYLLCRSKEFITSHNERMLSATQIMYDLHLEQTQGQQKDDTQIKMNDNFNSWIHADILSSNLPIEIANGILNHHWYLGISNKINPFIISDNPVATSGNGFVTTKEYISFPLSSTLSLILVGKGLLKSTKWTTKIKILLLENDAVGDLNKRQLECSYKQVFGNKETIEDLIRNIDLKSIERKPSPLVTGRKIKK